MRKIILLCHVGLGIGLVGGGEEGDKGVREGERGSERGEVREGEEE